MRLEQLLAVCPACSVWMSGLREPESVVWPKKVYGYRTYPFPDAASSINIDTNSRSLRCYLKRNRSAPILAVHSEPVREPWEIILKAMALQFYRALKTAAGRIPATSSNSLTAATTTRARLLRDRTRLRA